MPLLIHSSFIHSNSNRPPLFTLKQEGVAVDKFAIRNRPTFSLKRVRQQIN